MKKRGQAAMEFLMTYGWAILAAIIAIGVLAYFGIFSPGQLISSQAAIGPPFTTTAWNVDSSQAHIEIRNDGGEKYVIEDVSFTVNQGATSCTDTGNLGEINASQRMVVDVTCASMSSGDLFSADILITYSKTGSSLNLTSSGTMRGTIN